MTTKNFTEGAETLNKNVNNALKWFQDTTSAIMETQTKQMEFANDMYSKMVNNYLGEIKNEKYTNSFDLSKKMMDTMQKNIESFINSSNVGMKTIIDLGKKTDSTVYSKDFLNTMKEAFNKQIEMITTVNKNSFETLSKQFDSSKTAFIPEFEKSKQEFDANFKLSKDTMQEIVDSYAKLKTPTIEANTKMLDDLNKNMNNMADKNFKLWSELVNKNNHSEANKDSGLFKKQSHNGNGKVKTSETK